MGGKGDEVKLEDALLESWRESGSVVDFRTATSRQLDGSQRATGSVSGFVTWCEDMGSEEGEIEELRELEIHSPAEYFSSSPNQKTERHIEPGIS